MANLIGAEVGKAADDRAKTNILHTGGLVEWTTIDLPMGIRVIAES